MQNYLLVFFISLSAFYYIEDVALVDLVAGFTF